MGRTIRIIHVQRPEPVLPANESSPEHHEGAPRVGASSAATPSAA